MASEQKARAARMAVVENDRLVMQRALDASKTEGTKANPLSAESLRLIRMAEAADVTAWQIKWSNASVTERATMVAACQGYANSRRRRFGMRGKSHRDEWEAAKGFALDRSMTYINFLNRRGQAAHRRQIPTSRAVASSAWDWDAAVEAKLMFAIFPNLNPKEPVAGAKHQTN
jgi:hypothetical protein